MKRRKFINILLSLCLVVVIASFALMPACQSAPTTPIKLVYACWDNPESAYGIPLAETKSLLEGLKEKGGSNIEVELSFGGAFGKMPDAYDLLINHVIDMADPINPSFSPGRFPISDGLMLASPYPEPGPATMGAVKYAQAGGLDKEFSDVKILFVCEISTAPVWLMQPASSWADLKGRKIRFYGPVQEALLKSVGAIPVSMPSQEVYTSMQTGVIDGAIIPGGLAITLKLQDLAKCVMESTVGGGFSIGAMNKDAWDSLPKDAKAVIDENFTNWSMAVTQRDYELGNQVKQQVKDKGTPWIELTTAEAASLNKAFSGLYDNWIADLNSKGMNGEKIYTDIKSYMDEAGAGNCFGR